MPRGRKPKPQILAALHGRPLKPEHLTGLAGDEWDRIIALLDSAGNLSVVDGGTLEIYCQSYAKWRECERHLAEEGLMIESPNGYPMPSAYVAIGKQCEKTMLAIAQTFGMSPRSRKAIKQSEPKPKVDEKWKGY